MNNSVYIEMKSAEVKKAGEEKQAAWNKGSNAAGTDKYTTGGVQYFGGGEVVPTFEEAISSENDDKG